jgi:hypothetical protein
VYGKHCGAKKAGEGKKRKFFHVVLAFNYKLQMDDGKILTLNNFLTD